MDFVSEPHNATSKCEEKCTRADATMSGTVHTNDYVANATHAGGCLAQITRTCAMNKQC